MCLGFLRFFTLCTFFQDREVFAYFGVAIWTGADIGGIPPRRIGRAERSPGPTDATASIDATANNDYQLEMNDGGRELIGGAAGGAHHVELRILFRLVQGFGP